jgi:hypothetical protein
VGIAFAGSNALLEQAHPAELNILSPALDFKIKTICCEHMYFLCVHGASHQKLDSYIFLPRTMRK